jgi:sec-independent protein translocase protein TatC
MSTPPEPELTREEKETAPDEVEQYRMPLLDHLRELRTRMMRMAAALAVGLGISLLFTDEILAFIRAPLEMSMAANGIEGGLSINNSPFEAVSVWIRVALLGAVVLASPVLSYEIWAFVAPGLYKTERRIVVPLAMSSVLLFLLGAGFCYYVIFPFAFPWLLGLIDADVNLSIEGYLSSVLKVAIAFGVCFQLPVAVFFMARVGLVDHKDLMAGFRYALVAIFIIAAVLTPPDPLTQTLLAIPLTVLYVVSIVVARVFSTKVRV